jgi:hypothetical protein
MKRLRDKLLCWTQAPGRPTPASHFNPRRAHVRREASHTRGTPNDA